MVEEFVLKNERFRSTKVESELHLEKLILENQDVLFPFCFLFDYKRQAKTRTTGQITEADLCLVKHDCSQWWIIEVERSKNWSYTYDTIQPQIALQADADWNKSANHAVKQLKEFGVSDTLAMSIKSIEPGFILIYDDVDPNIAEIADEHGFKKIIFKPYLSDMGNYGIVPIMQEVNPGPSEENVYRIDSSTVKLTAQKLWIPISSSLKKRIGSKNLFILIDENIYPISIQMNNCIMVPISDKKSSQSSQLIYNRLKYVFDIDEDENGVNLVFREEKRWKK